MIPDPYHRLPLFLPPCPDLRHPPGHRQGHRGFLPEVRGRGFQARDQGRSHGVRPQPPGGGPSPLRA